MQNLSLSSKITLLIGVLTTILSSFFSLVIVLTVFSMAEIQIKDDLIKKSSEITPIAVPEKSEQLATYLRSNDISLLVFNENREIIARYGIYRNLDGGLIDELKALNDKAPIYKDKILEGFGVYDIYSTGRIQLSVKNNVTPILKKTFLFSLVMILPITWTFSVLVGLMGSKFIVNPFIKKQTRIIQQISHELKTPLTRALIVLQTFRNKKLKKIGDDLLKLGGDIDAILSISLLNKFTDSQNEKTELNNELRYYINKLPKQLTINAKISGRITVPIAKAYLKIIFKNLFENIAKYANPNGVVSINSYKDKNRWYVVLQNKKDPSVKQKGYGIGQSIIYDTAKKIGLKYGFSATQTDYETKLEGPLS